MKKILLLIFLILFLGGCADYKEVNDLAIVRSVGIDYKDDEFVVTLEVLNNKVDKKSGKVTSYTRTGSDENISTAIEKAADQLSLRPYYSHVKLMILSDSVAKEHFKELIDILIRSTFLRENYPIVVSNEKSPEELLNVKSEENPIPGEAIISLLENNSYASNYAVEKNFVIFLEETLDFGVDGALSVINEKENNFYIDGLAIFKEYNMVNILNNDMAALYNLLRSNVSKPVFNIDYEGETFAVTIYNADTNFDVTKDEIKIKADYKAKILDNGPNLNIRDTKILEKINKKFTTYLNNKAEEFITLLQQNDSDVLGFANIYYLKTREKNDKLWKYAKITSEIDFKINKKGLVYKEYENN